MSLVALSACGDTKAEEKVAEEKVANLDDTASQARPSPPPPPDKVRSFLAAGCEGHGESATKANCLCRVDVMDTTLDGELLAKLQTAPKDGPTEAVVEHLGGMANLSQVYEAMRKASQQCEEGATE